MVSWTIIVKLYVYLNFTNSQRRNTVKSNDDQQVITILFVVCSLYLTHFFIVLFVLITKQIRKLYHFHVFFSLFRFNLGWPCRLSSFDPLISTSVSYVFCSFNLIQPSFIRKASQQKSNFYLYCNLQSI